MRFCSRCGNPVPDGSLFCPRCGAALAPAPKSRETEKEPLREERSSAPRTGLDAAALVLTLLIFTAPVGLILAAVDLLSSKGKKSRLSVAALFTGSAALLLLVLFTVLAVRSLLPKPSVSPQAGLPASPSVRPTVSLESVPAPTPLPTPLFSPGPAEGSPSPQPASPTPARTAEGWKIGEVGKEDGFYIVLSDVRRSDRLSAVSASAGRVLPPTQEAVYLFLEICNDSGSVRTFRPETVSVLADGAELPDPGIGPVTVDGYRGLSAYKLDPGKKALLLIPCIAEKGWKTIQVRAGSLRWAVEPSDIPVGPFRYSTRFREDASPALTEKGTLLYSELCRITFDGLSVTTLKENGRDTRYAVFGFTFTNPTFLPLSTSLIQMELRGYLDGCLLQGPDEALAQTLDGYENVFRFRTLGAGKSVKAYVAFEIPLTASGGVYACVFDVQKAEKPMVIYTK